jgi:predicted Fe-Mo cluster-binding NifX family protein
MLQRRPLMRICIPTETTDGTNSLAYGHFGSAPFFTIFETETASCYSVPNNNDHHEHGTCMPLAALANEKVDIVVCRGMGARAVQILNERNIRAYAADGATVAEMVSSYQKGLCQELNSGNSCQNHSCH